MEGNSVRYGDVMEEITFNDIRKGDTIVVESRTTSGGRWIFCGVVKEVVVRKDDGGGVWLSKIYHVVIDDWEGVNDVSKSSLKDERRTWKHWPQSWFDDAHSIFRMTKKDEWKSVVLSMKM